MKGFLSIFQLLGQYIRQISIAFYRDVMMRDNQYARLLLHKQPIRLQILCNFEALIPRTEKLLS